MRTQRPRSLQLLSPQEAAALAEEVRARGQRVVFTNGVFDLLHPGHVRYLQEARSLGAALIVGVNSDRSVRKRSRGRHVLSIRNESVPKCCSDSRVSTR